MEMRAGRSKVPGLDHRVTPLDDDPAAARRDQPGSGAQAGARFSVDALFASWRRGGTDDLAAPARSRAYGLPIRCTWFLLGLLYFFPGVFKLWTIGLNWALGDALRYQMYEIWSKFEHFEPTFRVDKSDLLMAGAGISTVIFEVGYVFALIPRATRYWAAAGAFVFHKACGWLMHIPYLSLVLCYPIFVPWRALLEWLGRRVARRPLAVGADLGKNRARRTVALLRELDWCGLVTWDETIAPGAARLGDRSLEGRAAAQAIARRIPALWPLLPFLGARAAALLAGGAPAVTTPARARPLRLRAIATVSVFWIVGNALCGALALDTWPFTCYPRWDYWGEPVKPSLDIDAFDADGNAVAVDTSQLNRKFNPTRWDPLVMRVSLTLDDAEQRAMCAGLWELLAREHPSLRNVERVHFYETTVWVHPDHRGEPPLTRNLIHAYTRDELAAYVSVRE
jgi:hypothetical protein